MNNHLFLQILDDERIVSYNIEMGERPICVELLEGAVDMSGRYRLRNVSIVWHDANWAQIVFRSDEGQHIGEYQIVDLDSI